MAKFQPGKPRHPLAGRKKGTPNKRQSVQELIAKYGKDPIEVLVDLMMNGEKEDTRVMCAKELAQYVYKKKSQELQLTGKITHEMQQHIEELMEKSDEELDQVIEAEYLQLEEGKGERED